MSTKPRHTTVKRRHSADARFLRLNEQTKRAERDLREQSRTWREEQ